MSPENASYSEEIHFTYKSEPDKNNLYQGDILEITDELSFVINKIHPYFLNEKYKYFMILSQSCDLVRRKGKKCKTPYITLAVIEDFTESLENILIRNELAEKHNGLLLMDDKKRPRALQIIERLYNNTLPEYFFLYKEEALGLSNSMIAVLKVSFALRSDEHYEQCLNAKIIELTDEFKAKLGWLIGDMYSRVGTTDWDSFISNQEKSRMFNDDLESMCIVGSKEQIKYLKDEYLKNIEETPDREIVLNLLSGIQVKSKYDKFIEIVEEVIQTSSRNIPKEEKEKLINAFKSRSALRSLLQE